MHVHLCVWCGVCWVLYHVWLRVSRHLCCSCTQSAAITVEGPLRCATCRFAPRTHAKQGNEGEVIWCTNAQIVECRIHMHVMVPCFRFREMVMGFLALIARVANSVLGTTTTTLLRPFFLLRPCTWDKCLGSWCISICAIKQSATTS